MLLQVAARGSPLALKQCEEILKELHAHHPHVHFDLKIVDTMGDKDRKTSLRSLGKTDFFTREIDETLISGRCRIAIHSAKDLPDPLPEGLTVVALTQGVDPADALVMRPGDTLATLKKGAIIATSSVRREGVVQQLRSDLRFMDLRGNIGERLEKLNTGEADGVVVAEAALIRLGLAHLNRFLLPGETVAFQGQLAVMARDEDREMAELFACLDSRSKKTILYVGLEVPHSLFSGKVIHCPLIRTVPRSPKSPEIQEALSEMDRYTHVVFTSKTTVDLMCTYVKDKLLSKSIIAVGHATAHRISENGLPVAATAIEECAEGIVHLLDQQNVQNAYFFWPHSSKARSVLSDYFEKRGIRYRACSLYDTMSRRPQPLPDLNQFDEIHFTSPSTVDAFLEFFGTIPTSMKIHTIGPVTEAHLNNLISKQNHVFLRNR